MGSYGTWRKHRNLTNDFPAAEKISFKQHDHTCPGSHPFSYTNGTGISFLGNKTFGLRSRSLTFSIVPKIGKGTFACTAYPYDLHNTALPYHLILIKRLSVWWMKENSVKVKWCRYMPGVVQTVRRGIALLFYDRGTRRGWVVSSTPRPQFPPGKDPLPIVQEAGWVPGPVWTGEKSRPHPDSTPDPSSHSQSLYRLS